jgi:S1-C subfamily serine protease
MWLLLLACQLFYYSDDEIAQVEMTPVVNGWNIGTQRAAASTVKILLMSDSKQVGHGSGNLFYYFSDFFVVTSSHVIDHNSEHMIEEQNGNTLACKIIYNDIGNDIAILKPYGEFSVTKPSPYLVNMQKDLKAKELYYSGNPGELDHIAIRGWVADSDHRRVILQSFGWPGSSGSVVFDSAGRVVGVVTAIPVAHNFYEGDTMPLSQIVLVNRLEVLPRKTVREVLMNEKRSTKSRNSNK